MIIYYRTCAPVPLLDRSLMSPLVAGLALLLLRNFSRSLFSYKDKISSWFMYMYFIQFSAQNSPNLARFVKHLVPDNDSLMEANLTIDSYQWPVRLFNYINLLLTLTLYLILLGNIWACPNNSYVCVQMREQFCKIL